MIVHMRHDLRSSSPIILYHVPVVDTRGAAKCDREHAQPVAQVAGLARGGVCEFGRVATGTEEEMAAG